MKDQMKQKIAESIMATFVIPLMVFCLAYYFYRLFLLFLLAVLKAAATGA